MGTQDMGRAAVVGAAGFIGSHLCSYLAGDGIDVLAIDRNPMPGHVPVSARLEATFPELEVCEALASSDVNLIFLLAGTSYPAESFGDPVGDLAANARDLLAFLEFIRRRRNHATIVFVSSAAVYGESSQLPLTESSRTLPVSPYGVSKLAAELYARMYCDVYRLRTIVVRPFSVYGPGLQKQVVWDILRKLHAQDNPELLGTGSETRDFVYVSDMCAALLRVAQAGDPGTAYNVSSGREIPISTLAAKLADLAGMPRLRFSGVRRHGDPQRWCGDFTKLAALGWKPVVDLDQGLTETVKWFSEVASVPAFQTSVVA
jgi:nucleoside-diphosphate-sugar epimerase